MSKNQNKLTNQTFTNYYIKNHEYLMLQLASPINSTMDFDCLITLLDNLLPQLYQLKLIATLQYEIETEDAILAPIKPLSQKDLSAEKLSISINLNHTLSIRLPFLKQENIQKINSDLSNTLKVNASICNH